ncbi:MAG: DUF2155 domain-containing protein [Pseudomonadota bacterium]
MMMKRFLVLAACTFLSTPAFAQRIENPTAEFAGLDKITARIIKFDVKINETVQFGALQVTPRVCNNRAEADDPLTTGFVEVDEITLDNKIHRIFSGWMFADSPGLNAVEHPIYDIWLVACKGGAKPRVPEPEVVPEEQAPKAKKKSQRSQQRPPADEPDREFLPDDEGAPPPMGPDDFGPDEMPAD